MSSATSEPFRGTTWAKKACRGQSKRYIRSSRASVADNAHNQSIKTSSTLPCLGNDTHKHTHTHKPCRWDDAGSGLKHGVTFYRNIRAWLQSKIGRYHRQRPIHGVIVASERAKSCVHVWLSVVICACEGFFIYPLFFCSVDNPLLVNDEQTRSKYRCAVPSPRSGCKCRRKSDERTCTDDTVGASVAHRHGLC